MSEHHNAKAFREAMKRKAHERANGKSEAVDASGWKTEGEVEPLNTEAKTGMRPVSKRAFKRGGKVKGEQALHHAGRAKRKNGGVADELVNRNVKEANEQRPGEKHVGGMKKGGRTHKMDGGPLSGAPMSLGTPGVPQQRMNFAPVATRAKKGGKIEHPDRAKDERLAKELVKDHRKEGKHPHREEDLKAAEKIERDHRKSGGGNWIAGAIKHPGALHKELHVPEGKKIPEKKLEKAEHAGGVEGKRARLAETLRGLHRKRGGSAVADGEYEGTRPVGGREARAHGGKAGKGKMNVNIIIGAHAPGGEQQPTPMPPPPPHAVPVPTPPPPMPMGGPPGGMPPGAGGPPPGMPMPMPPPGGMPRKSGGRAYPIDSAAGGGEGRLEKKRAYGLKPHGEWG